jgi:hypothetical protein
MTKKQFYTSLVSVINHVHPFPSIHPISQYHNVASNYMK